MTTIDRQLEGATLRNKGLEAQLKEERQKNTKLYHDLQGQLAINEGLHRDLGAARETLKTLIASNQELTRQRQCQDVRSGQIMDTLEHVAIAAGALGRRLMK